MNEGGAGGEYDAASGTYILLVNRKPSIAIFALGGGGHVSIETVLFRLSYKHIKRSQIETKR